MIELFIDPGQEYTSKMYEDLVSKVDQFRNSNYNELGSLGLEIVSYYRKFLRTRLIKIRK